jgi:hypothetical protein
MIPPFLQHRERRQQGVKRVFPLEKRFPLSFSIGKGDNRALRGFSLLKNDSPFLPGKGQGDR